MLKEILKLKTSQKYNYKNYYIDKINISKYWADDNFSEVHIWIAYDLYSKNRIYIRCVLDGKKNIIIGSLNGNVEFDIIKYYCELFLNELC
jgi:hypothetical protein